MATLIVSSNDNGAAQGVMRSKPGTVLAIKLADGATPALIKVAGLKDASQDILITAFSQDAKVAHQVTQTVGGPEYIFTFGDVLQDLSIGLVLYSQKCVSEGNGATAKNSNSYKAAWDFYESKRLNPGQVVPVDITFAGVNLRGLIVGFKSDTETAQGFSVIRASLVLKGWAVSESNGDASGSTSPGASGSSGGPAPSPGPSSATTLPPGQI